MHILSTTPDDPRHQQLLRQLYTPDSPRHRLGHDPVAQHLEQCFLAIDGDQPVGRVAYYRNPVLQYKGEVAACLGSYECTEDTRVSRALLDHAIRQARRDGYRYVLGPMENSTWRSYRFAEVWGEVPPFMMEPYHLPYYAKQWRASGFERVATYYSTRDTALHYDKARLQAFEREVQRKGITLRPIDMSRLDAELRLIGAFSIENFADNLFYTPIMVEAFVAQYKPLAPLFDPEFIQLAVSGTGELQGFVFAIPDRTDTSGRTLIVKSGARRRDAPFRGLAAYFFGKMARQAKRRGFTNIIHAFMHEDNASLTGSKLYAQEVVREYGLYGLELCPSTSSGT